MTAKNDITGDAIQTRAGSEAFRSNYDAIFRKQEGAPVRPLADLANDSRQKADGWVQLELFE